jgi:hypothetical protein
MHYRSIIHCRNSEHQEVITKLAQKQHLSVKTCKYNPYGLIIKGSKKRHNVFCSMFENNPDYGVFYDHKHYKSSFYVYVPHYRLGNDVDINKLNTQLSMIPMDIYGRTPNWYRQMYRAELKSEASPIIAIISLNNNYDPEDLRSYWTHVCGLSEMPKVINILAGHKIKQRYTGIGVSYHNTLQLEIIGALCPKATILFISAPNTNTGLYQAMSTAIYGVKVHKIRYQPNIVLCAWGTSEASLKPSILNAFNNLFERAYERKITIIASAGDNGYDHNDVNFPASSPYVISVGGTTLFPDGIEKEWTWDPIFRWGTRNGLSNYFSTAHQKSDTPNDYRKVPDLSLNANPNHGYTIFIDNKLILNGIGGTGCAAALCTGFLGSMGDYIKDSIPLLYN